MEATQALMALFMPTGTAAGSGPSLDKLGFGWEELPCGFLFKMLFSKGCILLWRVFKPWFPFSKASQAFPPPQ